MTHWSQRYLGTPWVAGETDCWNFARHVWHSHFGREVPAVNFDATSPFEARRALRDGDMTHWQPTQEPKEGDAVMMAKGTLPCHVGVWTEGGVLHSVEGAGVIFTKAPDLLRVGYRITGIYEWRE